MINHKKLAPVIEGYKEYFPEHFKDERYKWEAVKHFQDNWDINAEDFGAMFKKATEKAGNLLGSAHSYPRGMMLEFAKADNEAVRQMFIHLYDENVDLAERIEGFIHTSEQLRNTYNDGTWNNHFQNTNTISVYLWLRYPDKYYIYKYEIYRDVANELDSGFQPKRRYTPDNIVGGNAMYDEICSVLQADKDIREMLDNALTESCYPDTKLKTLTVDFGFYLCRFYITAKLKAGVENIYNAVCSDSIDLSENTEQIIDNSKFIDKDSTEYNNEPIINTWLLNYNPSIWDWDKQDDELNYWNIKKIVNSGGTIFLSWRCASKKIKQGDRIFIIKLGSAPRGIVATGYATSCSFDSEYTEDDGTISSERLVDICITGVLDYHTEEILPQKLLKEKFPEQQWSPQGSGISIKPDAARWLIENWDSFQNKHNNDIESEWEDWNEPENEPVVWKISHGTPSTSGISKELRKILEERKAVIVNQYTSASIGQKTSQGDEYMYNIKAGDYFYLCYAGEIVLLGQFLDDLIIMNQEMYDKWGNDGWQERKYQLIALSNDHNKYTGKKKIWTSNYNSTCVKVTDNALFEELILEPYFGLKLSDLQITINNLVIKG